MEELVAMLEKQAHLSEKQAHEAVEVVVGFLNQKLPDESAYEAELVMKGKPEDEEVARMAGVFRIP